MARKPRVQFPGAIYHVVTRGDGRRELFHDEGHYQRLTDGLGNTRARCGISLVDGFSVRCVTWLIAFLSPANTTRQSKPSASQRVSFSSLRDLGLKPQWCFFIDQPE